MGTPSQSRPAGMRSFLPCSWLAALRNSSASAFACTKKKIARGPSLTRYRTFPAWEERVDFVGTALLFRPEIDDLTRAPWSVRYLRVFFCATHEKFYTLMNVSPLLARQMGISDLHWWSTGNEFRFVILTRLRPHENKKYICDIYEFSAHSEKALVKSTTDIQLSIISSHTERNHISRADQKVTIIYF